MRWILALLFASAMFALGCRQRPATSPEIKKPLASYRHAPGLRKSRDPQLRDELARLESEGAVSPTVSKESREKLSDTIVSKLRAIHPTSSKKELLSRYVSVLDRKQPKLGQASLEELEELRQSTRDFARSVANILDDSIPFGIEADQAFRTDYDFLETLELAHSFECARMAEATAAGVPDEGIAPLVNEQRIVRRLASVPNATIRAAVAQWQKRTFREIQGALKLKEKSTGLAEEWREALNGQIRATAPDESLWKAERESGISVFEIARDGFLVSLLDRDELETIKRENRLEVFKKKVTRNLDGDERFYLQHMRNWIASSKGPFTENRQLFVRIRSDLSSLEDTVEYPYLSGRILFDDFEATATLLAAHRATLDAWRFLLAEANSESPQAFVSVFDGKPFRVQRQEGFLIVGDLGSPGYSDTIVCADFSEQATKSRGTASILRGK